MPRTVDYTEFVEAFEALLPDTTAVTGQSADYWNQLQVRTEHLVEELQDQELVARRLASSSVGLGMLHVLSHWLRLAGGQNKMAFVEKVSEYMSQHSTLPWTQEIFCLVLFVTGKRHDSIKTISQSLLPEAVFNLIDQSLIDDHSKRLAYAMQVYYHEPCQLRLLMLFERAEAVGYSRYSLVPRAYIDDEPVSEEAGEQAARRIQDGHDLQHVQAEMVNQVLEVFEAGRRANVRRRSTCFAVHQEVETVLIFILRELRENYIREVNQTIFGDEAELVVLRISDRLRTIEEHSAQGVGPQIAGALAAHFLDDPYLEYLPDQSRTGRTQLLALIDGLCQGVDQNLRLQEVHLEHAPLDQSPALILRCDKDEDLSAPLRFLEERQIRLLSELNFIRSLGVVFKRHLAAGEQAYILRLVFEEVTSDVYFVRYYQRGAGAPTSFRRAFEHYLRSTYDVRVIPGTG